MATGTYRGSGTRRKQGRKDASALVAILVPLGHQIMRLPDKPPATLALVVAMVVLHLQPGELAQWIPTTEAGCLQPYKVMEKMDLKRLMWSPFMHADDRHLFWNMASLLWKGVVMEPVMGTRKFTTLVIQLLIGCQVVYLMLAWAAAAASPSLVGSYYSTCALGFSGVLFALKVVLTSRFPGSEAVYGIRVPAKLVCWVELIAASVVTPKASFLGHLAGIITGFGFLAASTCMSSRTRSAPATTGGSRASSGAAFAAARRLLRLLTGRRTRPFQGAARYAGEGNGRIGGPPGSDLPWSTRDSSSSRRTRGVSHRDSDGFTEEDLTAEVRRGESFMGHDGNLNRGSRSRGPHGPSGGQYGGAAASAPETTRGWPTPPGAHSRWWRASWWQDTILPSRGSSLVVAAAIAITAAVVTNPGPGSFQDYAATATNGVFGAFGEHTVRALLKLHGRSWAGGLAVSHWGVCSLACIGGRVCFLGAFGRWIPVPSGWMIKKLLPAQPLFLSVLIASGFLLKHSFDLTVTILHLEVGPSSHLWSPLLAGFCHDTVSGALASIFFVVVVGPQLPHLLPAFTVGGAMGYALLWAAQSACGALLWKASGAKVPLLAVLTFTAICQPTTILLRPQEAVAKLEHQVRSVTQGAKWIQPLFRATIFALSNGRRQHWSRGASRTWQQQLMQLWTDARRGRKRSGLFHISAAWTASAFAALPTTLTAQQLIFTSIALALLPRALHFLWQSLQTCGDGRGINRSASRGQMAIRQASGVRQTSSRTNMMSLIQNVAPGFAAVAAGTLMSFASCQD